MRKIIATLLTLAFCGLAYAEDAPTTAFNVTTDAFLDTGPIPVLYTCDGKDVSFSLTWANVPAKTKAFALVVKDPDASKGTFYHWVVYNIPGKTTTLAEGIAKLPAGSVVAKNSFGNAKYNGPCPPKGGEHGYVVTVYALDNNLSLPATATPQEIEKAVDKHNLGKAGLTTVYSRWLK